MSDVPEATTPCRAERCPAEAGPSCGDAEWTAGKWRSVESTPPIARPTAAPNSETATASCARVVVDSRSAVDGGPDSALPSVGGKCEPCCSNGIELAQAVGNGTGVEHPEASAAVTEGPEVLNNGVGVLKTPLSNRGEHRTRVSVAGALTLLVAAYLQTQIPP